MRHNGDIAIKLATEVKLLLDSGGFKLTKFSSNSKKVFLSLSPDELAPGLKVYCRDWDEAIPLDLPRTLAAVGSSTAETSRDFDPTVVWSLQRRFAFGAALLQ